MRAGPLLVALYTVVTPAVCVKHHVGRPDQTAGQFVSKVVHLNRNQALELVDRINNLPNAQTNEDVMNMVIQGGLQFLYDISSMDPEARKTAFAKFDRQRELEELSEEEQRVVELATSVSQESDQKVGTPDHAPTQLHGQFTEMAEEMEASSNLVEQVEALVDEIASKEPEVAVLETYDEGGGELLPRKFASSILRFTQRMQNTEESLTEQRREMLDGMAKRFAAAVVVAGSQQAGRLMAEAKEGLQEATEMERAAEDAMSAM